MGTSVVRAVRILEVVARSEKPMTLAEVVATLSIPRSTAYSILTDLMNEGFLVASPPSAYTIGLKAFEVGSAHLRAIGTIGVVMPQLVRLTRQLDHTSHFAVLDGSDAVYLCKEDPPGLGVKLASSIGARLPAHLTAVGKACLSGLNDDLLAQHVSLKVKNANGKTITMKQLVSELALIRDQGWAADDAQTTVGVQCIAAPVFDLGGIKGAIGVSFLSGASDLAESIRTEVMATADRVSGILGGASTQ